MVNIEFVEYFESGNSLAVTSLADVKVLVQRKYCIFGRMGDTIENIPDAYYACQIVL
jgi:hypothetical protein